MKKPIHQQLIFYISWMISGFVALGAMLDAISNAISIITIPVAILGTMILLLSMLTLHFTLKVKPVSWMTKDGQLIRVKKIGLGLILPVVGMIVLLWTPLIIENYKSVFSITNFPPATIDETLILIVELYSADGIVDVNIDKEIQQRIKQAIDEASVNNVRIEILSKPLRFDQVEEARELGLSSGADVVIWGEDTGVRLEVRHLNVNSGAVTEISEVEKTQLTNPSDYSHYVVEELPARFAPLTMYSIAKSYFSNEEYERALAFFLITINTIDEQQFGGEIEKLLSDSYFNIGWIYQNEMKDDWLAIAAYSLAIDTLSENAEEITPKSYRNLGLAYRNIGNFSKSIENLQIYFQNNPSVDDKAIIEEMISQMEFELERK